MSAITLTEKPDVIAVPLPTSLTAVEVGERGRAIYKEEIQSMVEPLYLGKVLTLDIFSHDYEVGELNRETLAALKLRRPAGRFYTLRIGEEFFGRV